MKRFPVLLLVSALLCQYSFGQSDQQAKQVRILTFNIYHGETMKGDFDLDLIAGVIQESDPDLVALQEVDFKTKRTGYLDLATELGQRSGLIPVFAAAMDFDGGFYGNAILSRRPLLTTVNHVLPSSPGKEPRTALVATTTISTGDTIGFIATHLDYVADDTDRISQARFINQLGTTLTSPAVLAGDLNDIPGSRAIGIFEEFWQGSYDQEFPAPTFPSPAPDRKIDYIMFQPPGSWKVISHKVIPDMLASDHCAYLAVLELLD